VRYLTWIVTLPLTLIVVSFAISNRETASLALWPLPGSIDLPVFVVALVPLALGIVIGGLIDWLMQAGHRRQERRLKRQVGQLEGEVKEVRTREAEARRTAAREEEAARLAHSQSAADRAAREELADRVALPPAAGSERR
jgi:uncharacterized integral membrane protein